MSLNGEQYSACKLGKIAYESSNDLAGKLLEARMQNKIGDIMLLIEPSDKQITFGGSDEGNYEGLLVGKEIFAAKGIELISQERGGASTYIGPGQLLVFFIARIHSAKDHVRLIERIIAAAIKDQGVDCRTRIDEGMDFIGVWAGNKKIASIGIEIHGSVATHGFTVNIDGDLEPWKMINPCGFDFEMTSISEEKGTKIDHNSFIDSILNAWAAEIGSDPEVISKSELDSRI